MEHDHASIPTIPGQSMSLSIHSKLIETPTHLIGKCKQHTAGGRKTSPLFPAISNLHVANHKVIGEYPLVQTALSPLLLSKEAGQDQVMHELPLIGNISDCMLAHQQMEHVQCRASHDFEQPGQCHDNMATEHRSDSHLVSTPNAQRSSHWLIYSTTAYLDCTPAHKGPSQIAAVARCFSLL